MAEKRRMDALRPCLIRVAGNSKGPAARLSLLFSLPDFRISDSAAKTANFVGLEVAWNE